jgi:hypothetical protein
MTVFDNPSLTPRSGFLKPVRRRQAHQRLVLRDHVMREPIVEMVCDIIEEPVSWIWPARFETGALCCLGADPGVGKSLFMAEMAAHVTTGTP